MARQLSAARPYGPPGTFNAFKIDADASPESLRAAFDYRGDVTLTLDDGTAIDFVDVPGHERFVPTMLAGGSFGRTVVRI